MDEVFIALEGILTVPHIAVLVVSYAIVHTIFALFQLVTKPLASELEHEFKRYLIALHKKDGHDTRLVMCEEGECAKLTMKNQPQAQLLQSQELHQLKWS